MMMHPLCLKRLEKYLKSENDRVKNVVLNLCMSSSEPRRLADVDKPYQLMEDKTPVDSRIKWLAFDHFRTYPGWEYGANFQREDKISSLLLVGLNGSGKSTLYTALEKIYTGHSSYADQMSEKKDDYLTFGFATSKYPQEKVWKLGYRLSGSAKSNMMTPNSSQNSPIAVPAFFSSDIDVQNMKNKKTLFKWILEQMGFANLEQGLQWLKKLREPLVWQKDNLNSNGIFSTSEYQELLLALIQYDSGRHKKEVENCKENVPSETHELFEKSWNQFYSCLSDGKESSDSHGTDEENGLIGTPSDKTNIRQKQLEQNKEVLKSLYTKLSSIVKEQEDEEWKIQAISSLMEEQKLVEQAASVERNADKEQVDADLLLLDSVEKAIKQIQVNLVGQFLQDYGNHIANLMSKFSNHNEIYKFTPMDNLENVVLSIHASLQGDYFTTPHEYFNEFRFKLYCVTMKIAIAYDWMLREKKALPIVIDDIFNASDFENSIKLEYFAYNIKKLYDENVRKHSFEYPLQLIITSHDDLVIHAFERGYSGLSYSDFSESEVHDYPLIVGRMYRLDELEVLKKDKTLAPFVSFEEENLNITNIYSYVSSK